MTPGTLACARIKGGPTPACACGWSMTPRRSNREAVRQWQFHIRLVRVSLKQAA